jgi:hypothetical protein
MTLRRLAYIENRKVLADAGEVSADILVKDPITALWFELRATNGATSNKANLVADCVDQVDVLDGSDVLVSLDGHELFANGVYRLGHIPYQLITEGPSQVQNLSVPILFGRFLGDAEYALDPTKFANLQVRVKWNLSNVATVAATAFATGTGTLTLVADVLEGAGAPKGLITAKEHYSYASAASGVEYIDLPTDHNMRALYIRAYEAAIGTLSDISNVKISCDQGKFVPVDMRRTDFVRYLTNRTPPFHYKHYFFQADGATIYCVLKQDEVAALTGAWPDRYVSYVNNGIGEGVVNIYGNGGVTSGNQHFIGLIEGFLPFGTVRWLWGEDNDPNSWLPASMFDSVRLELTQEGAGGTGYVVVEQERLY